MCIVLSAAFSFAALLLPVHGTVLGPGPHGTTIIRNDPVTGAVPAQTRAYRVSPRLALPTGVGVDGFVDRTRTPWRWYDTAVAARFTAGLPDAGKVIPIDLGSPLPHTQLVDQNGRRVDLSRDFRGKVRLISFVFTRCPDKGECPAVSAKFAYLQKHLDGRRFHLITMTLDPVYDSPWVLHRYAAQFGADANQWSILTGQPQQIAHLLNRFGISSLRVNDANFIHNDKVFLAGPDGTVADIVQGAGFSGDAMAAQARHLAGMVSNPFGRLQLALVAGAAALCGGSQFAGVVLLETVLFLVIAVISFFTLGWIARKLWKSA